jgi:hypothetical protein
MNKKNAQEYKKEMQDLLNCTEKLKQIVVTRLYTLCVRFPDAIIVQQGDIDIKAKSLIGTSHTKEYIKTLDFNVQIQYIEAIEKWLEEKSPIKQLSIEF